MSSRDGVETYWAIVKWDEYQHYRDRAPPWVKLHVRMLDDDELAELPPNARLVAVLLLLVASRSENRITTTTRILAQSMKLPTKIVTTSLEHLEKIGYIERRHLTKSETDLARTGQQRLDLASTTLASAADDASAHARPRARGEAETETEDLPSSATSTPDVARPPATPSTALPRSTTETTRRLVELVCGGDQSSIDVVASLARRLPEQIVARTIESYLGRNPKPDNPAGYAVATLKRIAAETGVTIPEITREPDL